MSDVEVFGPLVLGDEPEEAVQTTLEKWLPTHLAMVSRKKGMALPVPRSYVITSDWDHFPEEQLPAVLIMCEDVLDPKMDGRKYYRAVFSVRVGIVVEARDRKTTDRLAKFYAGAVRSCINSRGSLEGFAIASSWKGEAYNRHVADRSQRTLSDAEVRFNVEVREVARRLVGPEVPQPPSEVKVPGPPLPVVKKGTITYQPKSITS